MPLPFTRKAIPYRVNNAKVAKRQNIQPRPHVCISLINLRNYCVIRHSLKRSDKWPGILKFTPKSRYLTIIPRARMGSESIAHEAEGSEATRVSKIQLVGQKYRDKTTLAS